MAYEMLVALDVSDSETYQAYRDAMAPILKQYAGEFGYDFQVAEVLKSESEQGINRVFTIRFPDEATKTNFFADPDYQAVKAKYFEASVVSTTLIAAYDRADG